MKHISFADKNVVCPFYRYQETHKICCEGIKKNSTLHLAFGDPTERKRHCAQFCNSLDGYPLCPVAKMLNKKY